jgi:mannose-6-phosphate isomerase-like protein (cupin superfamily)
MPTYETKPLPETKNATAPDGSEVRILSGLKAGGMAHFRLMSGQVSRAVTHRTVEEIWYILGGRGQMWRSYNGDEDIVDLKRDMSLTVPLGTHFQFRTTSDEPLDVVGVTMPPWPGEGEASIVKGPWTPNVPYPEAERPLLVKFKGDHVHVQSPVCGSLIEILRGPEFAPSVAILEDVRSTIGHYHENFDEVYFVLDGSLDVKLFEPKSGSLTEIKLHRYELCVIPRGVHHQIIIRSRMHLSGTRSVCSACRSSTQRMSTSPMFWRAMRIRKV